MTFNLLTVGESNFVTGSPAERLSMIMFLQPEKFGGVVVGWSSTGEQCGYSRHGVIR